MAIDTLPRPLPPEQPEDTLRRYYRPRWIVRLDVPKIQNKLGGIYAPADASDVVSIWCNARMLETTSNSHKEADHMTAIVDWKDAGVDPRVLSSAIVTVYVGQADLATGDWTPKDSDIRFIGVMKRSKRSGGEGEGMIVEIVAHDYTTLFLEAKKFPATGVPDLTDTISAAWAKICDHTGVINPKNPHEILPTVTALRNRIRFVGSDDFVKRAFSITLGDAVSSRFKKIGKLQLHGVNQDAWAVWQEVVGMLGLISYIRLDECIVTTATDYYTISDAPVFVWGHNIESICEDRDTMLCGKGVCLQSFDPLSGTQLESFHPPNGDASILKHKVTAKKKAPSQAQLLAASDYECFAYPGVTVQSALDEICVRVYQERAHQELEGRLTTAEFVVKRVSSKDFDLMGLQSGDSIEVRINSDDAAALTDWSLGGATKTEQIDFLVARGYREQLAELVVENLDAIVALSPTYLVKRVTLRLETTPEGGKCRIEIAYCNKIDPSGSSS